MSIYSSVQVQTFTCGKDEVNYLDCAKMASLFCFKFEVFIDHCSYYQLGCSSGSPTGVVTLHDKRVQPPFCSNFRGIGQPSSQDT